MSISLENVFILQASKLLALQSELTVLLICQHENILRLSGLLLDEGVLQGFGLVTEFADHDTLDMFLYEGSEFVVSFPCVDMTVQQAFVLLQCDWLGS